MPSILPKSGGKNNINHNFSFYPVMEEVSEWTFLFRPPLNSALLTTLSSAAEFADFVIDELNRKNKKNFFIDNTFKIDCFCHYFQHFYLYPVESGLSKNKYYRAVFKSIASILLILPVGSMILLSGMLSAAVYRRNKLRRGLARLTAVTDRMSKVSFLLNFSIVLWDEWMDV